MTKKTRQQKILEKYCPTCGDVLTIGNRGGLYCKRCSEAKKEKCNK